MLDVKDVVKHYGSVLALDGVGFTVGRGQLLGFLGPNGAGKTTTMRAILGLISLDGGTITWDGAPIDDAVRRHIGYMPAERGMYPKMRVREHVVYYARLAGLDRHEAERAADRWLERVDLADRRDTDVQDLSSGNQQRVQLALALVNDPDLLVLDEPFSGLDPLAVDILKEILVERVEGGSALLFSSHQLDLVQDLSRDVVVIDHGRIVLEGAVDHIRRSAPHRYVTIAFAGRGAVGQRHRQRCLDAGRPGRRACRWGRPRRGRPPPRPSGARPRPGPGGGRASRTGRLVHLRTARAVRGLPPDGGRPMRPTSSPIPLIAQREIRQRLRSKAFFVFTGLIAVAIIGIAMLNRALSNDGPTSATVVVTGQAPPGLDATLRAAGDARNLTVDVATATDRAAAVSALEGGKADAAIVVPADGQGELLFRRRVDSDLQATVASAWQISRGAEQAASSASRRATSARS